MNPYHPYYLTDTVKFYYDDELVIGTIMKFGKNFFTMLTKDGRNDYYFDKMKVEAHYSCQISSLVNDYLRGNKDFEYLYKAYGSRPSSEKQWKID